MKKDIDVILSEFEGYYSKFAAARFAAQPRDASRLRVSNLPYCGLRELYTKWIGAQQYSDFGNFYYTSVGTIFHSIVQDFLGKGGRIHGDWKCRDNKCRGCRRFSSDSKCPKCGLPMEYKELTVRAYRHISGHLDGVYQTRDGEWFVIDYKTCSTRIIKTNHEHKMLPYSGNVAQIRAYCALVELLLGVKISGWVLLYVARDNPMKCYRATGAYVTDKEKEKIIKKLGKWDEDFEQVSKATTLKDTIPIVERKACKSQEFYDLYYRDIEGCPLAENGCCFDDTKRTSAIKEAYRLHKL